MLLLLSSEKLFFVEFDQLRKGDQRQRPRSKAKAAWYREFRIGSLGSAAEGIGSEGSIPGDRQGGIGA